MEVKVGQALSYRGETWIISKISENKWTEYAGCTAKEYQELYIDIGTQNQILERHFDDFSKDDIVSFEESRIILEQPGKNNCSIITKIRATRVREEKQDGVLCDSTNKPTGEVRDEEPVADVHSSVGTEGRQ